MADHRITIGIPTYRRIDTLRRAIDSVRSQSMQDWHLIVSDNAADPAVQVLVETYDDERLTYVGHAKNLGAGGNFNFVLETSDTEFCAILHDDDWYEPEFIEDMLSGLDWFPRAEWAFCNTRFVHNESTREHSLNASADQLREFVEAGRAPAGDLLGLKRRVHCSSVVFRHVVSSRERFSAELMAAGDFQLWLRLALQYPFVYVGKSLVRSLEWAGSDSIKVRASGEVLRDLQAIYDWIPSRPEMEGAQDEVRAMRRAMVRRNCGLVVFDPHLAEYRALLPGVVEALDGESGTVAAITRGVLASKRAVDVLIAVGPVLGLLRRITARARRRIRDWRNA